MSVELEWELYDIFDSGMFAFPIYDHNSARRIVRYLMMKGILSEEIAEAIEDSTGDLMMWLNRHGKHKIGEWVIAWVNECREEFERGELHKMDEAESDFDRDFFLREETPESDPGHHSDGDDPARPHEADRRSDSRITDLDSISSQAGTSSTCADAHLDSTEAPPDGGGQNHGLNMLVTKNQKFTPIHYSELPPPPLPSRTLPSPPLTPFMTMSKRRYRPSDLDLSQTNLQSSTEGLYEPPDSGHFSDLYTSIPSDKILDTMTMQLNNNSVNSQCTAKLLQNFGCKFHNNDNGQNEDNSTPLKCTCSVAHYSYIRNQSAKGVDDIKILDLPQDKMLFQDAHSYCDIYFGESVTRAMEYKFDTLDHDGPGFIFIMTDSIANCLPWSSEHLYKIASSRKPDRCLLEFRTRNIEVDLIWQVKVKNHMKAIRDVQMTLQKYNLHSNWFKCSLSLIMDTVSRVAKRYK